MRAFVKTSISYVLQMESRAVLWKYKPKVIAITGSLGKTSTKDAVYAALSGMTHVRKSQKSYNSEIGLPLTILGLPNGWNNPFVWFENFLLGLWLIIAPHKYPKWLVLEVGVGKPGDMKKTASWLKTDAVIITAIGETPAHIEFFSSRKHLIEEKSELIKTLKKDGLLVLNADDEAVLGMKEKTKCRTITYGFNPEADVVASQDNIYYGIDGIPEGIIFRVDESGVSMPVAIEGVFGRNHLYASLAAITLSVGLKFNVLHAIEHLKAYDVPAGRMRLLSGINDTFIIDDTYNSSPFACESALRTLREVNGGRKIAILGDMLELGKHTVEAHKNVGKVAKENADILVVVGPRACDIKVGAIEAGMSEGSIFDFTNSTEAGAFAEKLLEKNDLVLVKGSQGVRMERVVSAILKDKKNQNRLLVRQEPEWLEKK
ncbi:MAG: UDP-N-acetylmuramoyl-tripeptide--D-alanyl-D-alanine ligase [Candidatus Pacebacteria bacterium]|nr:UDP-N-acetylmuramoyl-tripeptide--D-alanyl-D-alanine ligase [Candidatus Paceibacterota bacterium]